MKAGTLMLWKKNPRLIRKRGQGKRIVRGVRQRPVARDGPRQKPVLSSPARSSRSTADGASAETHTTLVDLQRRLRRAGRARR